MDKQEFEKRIEERWRQRGKHPEKGRIWVGAALLIVGGLFLARNAGLAVPTWIFSWQVFLIGLGLFIGIRHRFRGFGWLFPIAIGGLFLVDKLSPDINLRPYFWPILLIAAGLFIIFRPRNSNCRRGWGRDDNFSSTDATTVPNNTDATNVHSETNNITANTTSTQTTADETENWKKAMIEGNDVIDITAIFGGVKKNVLSKNFKGGEIVAVMGGAEVNLTQADFTGRVMIDSFNMFGGTKLIVPPDWEVQSNIVTIFGGVDDKRSPVASLAPGKVLYLDGTCLFGGLEIRSY